MNNPCVEPDPRQLADSVREQRERIDELRQVNLLTRLKFMSMHKQAARRAPLATAG